MYFPLEINEQLANAMRAAAEFKVEVNNYIQGEMKTDVLAFKITSDSMNDGTRSSFEPGDKLIVQPFDLNDFRDAIGNDLNSFWVIEVEQGILIRQIVEYANDMIKCHLLNTSGQYPDAFIKVEDITKIYRVMRRQSRVIHYDEG